MKQFLEYFVFISALYYKKVFPKWKDWEDNSLLSLSICYWLIICNFLLAFQQVVFGKIVRKLNLFEIVFLITFFFILNYYVKKKYQNRHEEFKENWDKLSQNKRLYMKIGTVLFLLFS